MVRLLPVTMRRVQPSDSIGFHSSTLPSISTLKVSRLDTGFMSVGSLARPAVPILNLFSNTGYTPVAGIDFSSFFVCGGVCPAWIFAFPANPPRLRVSMN